MPCQWTAYSVAQLGQRISPGSGRWGMRRRFWQLGATQDARCGCGRRARRSVGARGFETDSRAMAARNCSVFDMGREPSSTRNRSITTGWARVFLVQFDQLVDGQALQGASPVGRRQQDQVVRFGAGQLARVQQVFCRQIGARQHLGGRQQACQCLDRERGQIEQGRAAVDHVLIQRLDGAKTDAQLSSGSNSSRPVRWPVHSSSIPARRRIASTRLSADRPGGTSRPHPRARSRRTGSNVTGFS